MRQNSIVHDDSDPQLLGEARLAMENVVDMNLQQADTLTLQEGVNMLNECEPEPHLHQRPSPALA